MIDNSVFETWLEKHKCAVDLMQIVGKLWYDRAVELQILRKPLLDSRTTEVLQYYKLLEAKSNNEGISMNAILEISKVLLDLDLSPSKIDVGKLFLNYKKQSADLNTFVQNELQHLIGQDKINLEAKDVVLFGFGRIGRLLARILIEQTGKGNQLRLKAIVCRNNSSEDAIEKRASLLRKDSVHGRFRGTITEDYKQQKLIINGNEVQMIESKDPSELDYSQYGIENALVIDNTGIFRDDEALGKHLQSKGVSKVLLTAPGKGNIPNIVFGVNHEGKVDGIQNIFSAASCTTNAIVPILKIIEDQFGLEKGHLETVHAFTNDQNLLDNFHKKYRRGRSAPLNMVITETGAAKAAVKAIPSLAGKLTANAVRVPTPDVSLAIMSLTLKRETSLAELEQVFQYSANESSLVDQLEYSQSNELVSSDIIGNRHTSIIDGKASLISNDNKNVVLYVWYDNEYGYSWQVIRLAKYVSGVDRLRYL